MKHDCRLGSYETGQDDNGQIYIQFTSPFLSEKGKFKVEYCPVCGMKSPKSSIEHLTMYDREDSDEDE